MQRASSRLPKRITLIWGSDRLEVDDPVWIAKIVHEMGQNSQSDEDGRIDLFEPRSRMVERMEVNLGFAPRSMDSKALPNQAGYQAPEQQGPVAAEALRVFLGLELPVALNFKSLGNRSAHRMSAVHTAFRRSRFHYNTPDELNLCWMFSGYQLYATHQIGTAQVRPFPTEGSDHIERRLLNGQWIRWSFDGGSPHPHDRLWSDRRTFILAANGTQRVGSDDSDLKLEYHDLKADDDAVGGIPPSQEAR
ncbi:hypothetical protein [Pseudomonas grimontii]|uniref:hypothetical protein n=1 Tax=Pseudomonas grimontii TaxID=129847 RepID=UPI00387B234A